MAESSDGGKPKNTNPDTSARKPYKGKRIEDTRIGRLISAKVGEKGWLRLGLIKIILAGILVVLSFIVFGLKAGIFVAWVAALTGGGLSSIGLWAHLKTNREKDAEIAKLKERIAAIEEKR